MKHNDEGTKVWIISSVHAQMENEVQELMLGWGARRGDYEKWCFWESDAACSFLKLSGFAIPSTAFSFRDNCTMKAKA
jgi:hypothetical protein